MARYHRVGVLLRKGWAEYERRHGKTSLRQFSEKKLNMQSPAALSQWLNGLRAPPAVRIDELSLLFYEGAADGQQSFRDKVNAAIAQSSTEPKDPFDEINVAEGRGINWGVLRYGCIARLHEDGRTTNGFLDRLFQRFLAFAALPHAEDSLAREVPFENVATELTQSTVDILVGQMATVDRALRQEYFPTPIRIGINAVYHESFTSWRKDLNETALRDALTFPGNRDQRQNIFPLIQEQEVGGLYVIHALGFASEDYRSIPFGAHIDYARALSQLEERDRVPVAVVDEYTCAKIVDAMNGEGRFVFPVAGSEGQTLPVYAVGLTVNRQHRLWIEYLRKGLSLFLAADAQYIANQYALLWRTLRGELAKTYAHAFKEQSEDECQRGARAWADSILSLDKGADVPDAWRAIVERAKIILGKLPHRPTEGDESGRRGRTS